MGLKAVFFDLDDTLYTSFQAGDAYAYEKLEEWAISTFGDKGKGFADAFRVNRKRLARQQPAMPPTHDRVLFAQGALERMGLNAVRYSREAFRVYWNAVFAKMTLRPGVAEFLDKLLALLVCGRLFKNCGTVSRKLITDTAELSLQPVIDFVIHARSPFIEFRHIL